MWLRASLLFAAVVGAGACNHAPPLPDGLARAQQAERNQEPLAALAQYDALVATCRQGPSRDAKDPCGTAALRRAQILEQLGRHSEAAGAYAEARTLSHEARNKARALVRAAGLWAGPLGQPTQALVLCREVVTTWPAEVAAEDALKLWVELATERNDPSLPGDLIGLAEQLRPHEIVASFALYYAARSYERGGNRAAALAAYDQIWARYPRGPLFDDALMAAAQLLRAQGRSAEAAERLERLEATFTKAILIGHYNKLLLDEGALLLGETYLRDLRQPDRAIGALARFLKRQRTSLLCDDALLLMAEASLARHQPPAAEDQRSACEYLDRLRREYPDGNRVRRAGELQTQLRCPQPTAPTTGAP